MNEFQDIKDDFPIFEREINSKKLTYLDSGATSQKPKTVIEAMNNVYLNTNANVHRGTYVLSAETTQLYEVVYIDKQWRQKKETRPTVLQCQAL